MTDAQRKIAQAYLDLRVLHLPKEDEIARLRELQDAAAKDGLEAWRLFFEGSIAGAQGRWQAALDSHRQAFDLDPSHALALLRQGYALSELGARAEALRIYDEVQQRFGKSDELAHRAAVSIALHNKAVVLTDAGLAEDALRACDEVVLRFADCAEAVIAERVASALVNKGVALGEARRSEEAAKVYDEVIQRFADRAEPGIAAHVAKALVNKGVALGEAGRPEEAVKVFDEIVRHLAGRAEPRIAEQVAKALFNKGVALGQAGRPEEELNAYDEVVRRFADRPEPGIAERVAKALGNKGVALGKAGRSKEAVGVFDEVVRRFAGGVKAGITEGVASALFNKGVELGLAGRPEEAIKVYDEVVLRFADRSEPGIVEMVASALFNKGVTLGKAGRPEDALKVFDEVVRRFADRPELGIAEVVAKARLNKALALRKLGKTIEAEEELKAINPASLSDPALAEKVSFAKSSSEEVPQIFKPDEGAALLARIEKKRERLDRFLREKSRFREGDDAAFLFVLREWNSYTPIVPDEDQPVRGGGYFIWYRGQGIVVDPGYNFVENFVRIGGRMCDIQHVVVTHSHNDHTAELESLITLKHQHNKETNSQRGIYLYLSEDADRKFAGFAVLNDPDNVKKKYILSHWEKSHPRRMQFAGLPAAFLTVLRANHDDPFTRDFAVGLGLDFQFGNETRRLILTGDTGYFPKMRTDEGELVLMADGMPAVDDTRPLFEEYPDYFRKVDLVIPHIGSVKRSEVAAQGEAAGSPKEAQIVSAEKIRAGEASRPRAGFGSPYYADHLGMLGVCKLLHKLDFKAAVISEWGEELKDVRKTLTDGIACWLRKTNTDKKFVLFPGDLTIVYDIAKGKFHCHNTGQFEDPSDLRVEEQRAADGTQRIWLLKGPGSGRTLPQTAAYYTPFAQPSLPWLIDVPDSGEKKPGAP